MNDNEAVAGYSMINTGQQETSFPCFKRKKTNTPSETSSREDELHQSNQQLNNSMTHDDIPETDLSNGRPIKKPRCCFKSVRFPENLEREMNVRPYCAEQSDAETLQLCHAKIWYEPVEYLSFLNDRADTVRIYRSLNGKMQYLTNHYTTRGLEHLLPLPGQQKRRLAPRSQQLLTTKILTEQQREGSNSETVRDLAVEHSAPALAVALRRANEDQSLSSCSATITADGMTRDKGVVVDDDDDDCSTSDEEDLTEVVVACQVVRGLAAADDTRTSPQTKNPSLVELFGSNRRSNRTLDLSSLRKMNFQLVENMKHSPSFSSASHFVTTNSGGSAADRTREMLRAASVLSPLWASSASAVTRRSPAGAPFVVSPR